MMKLFIERQDVMFNIHFIQYGCQEDLDSPLLAAIQNKNKDALNLLVSDDRFVALKNDIEIITDYIANNHILESDEPVMKRISELLELKVRK